MSTITRHVERQASRVLESFAKSIEQIGVENVNKVYWYIVHGPAVDTPENVVDFIRHACDDVKVHYRRDGEMMIPLKEIREKLPETWASREISRVLREQGVTVETRGGKVWVMFDGPFRAFRGAKSLKPARTRVT